MQNLRSKIKEVMWYLDKDYLDIFNDFEKKTTLNIHEDFDLLKRLIDKRDQDVYERVAMEIGVVMWYQEAIEQIVSHFANINLADEVTRDKESTTYTSQQLEKNFKMLLK